LTGNRWLEQQRLQLTPNLKGLGKRVKRAIPSAATSEWGAEGKPCRAPKFEGID